MLSSPSSARCSVLPFLLSLFLLLSLRLLRLLLLNRARGAASRASTPNGLVIAHLLNLSGCICRPFAATRTFGGLLPSGARRETRHGACPGPSMGRARKGTCRYLAPTLPQGPNAPMPVASWLIISPTTGISARRNPQSWPHPAPRAVRPHSRLQHLAPMDRNRPSSRYVLSPPPPPPPPPLPPPPLLLPACPALPSHLPLVPPASSAQTSPSPARAILY